MQQLDNTSYVGVKIGGTLGFLKALYVNINAMIFLDITWRVILETAVLSGIGALIGLVVTYYGKKVLDLIHKRK